MSVIRSLITLSSAVLLAGNALAAEPAAQAQNPQKPLSRAEVLAELRDARARGELDFAAAEVGLPLRAVVKEAGAERRYAASRTAAPQR